MNERELIVSSAESTLADVIKNELSSSDTCIIISAFLGTGSCMAYAASKGALNTMTISMARILAPEIRVNAVCPGFVRGDWIRRGLGDKGFEEAKARWEADVPLGTTAEPDDIAEAIVYLLAGARVVTGETLLLNAGVHLKKAALVRK